MECFYWQLNLDLKGERETLNLEKHLYSHNKEKYKYVLEINSSINQIENKYVFEKFYYFFPNFLFTYIHRKTKKKFSSTSQTLILIFPKPIQQKSSIRTPSRRPFVETPHNWNPQRQRHLPPSNPHLLTHKFRLDFAAASALKTPSRTRRYKNTIPSAAITAFSRFLSCTRLYIENF